MRLFVVKLLIFSLVLVIFLLEHCNADQKTFKQCKETDGQLLDPKDKKGKKICILSEDSEDIKFAPEDPTEITITFNNVNVDEIVDKSNQLTISMQIKFTWAEDRLLLKQNGISVKGEFIKNRIWSPEITLKTSDFSSKTTLKFVKDSHNDDSSKSALKSFNLEITRKCHMDFQSFPFDNHECIFEVGII